MKCAKKYNKKKSLNVRGNTQEQKKICYYLCWLLVVICVLKVSRLCWFGDNPKLICAGVRSITNATVK